MDEFRQTRRARGSAQTIDGFLPQRRFTPKTDLRSPGRPAYTRDKPLVQRRRLEDHTLDSRVFPSINDASSQPKPSRILPEINMDLPESTAPSLKSRLFRNRNKKGPIRKWSFRAAAACLVILLGFGTFWYIQFHRAFGGGASAVALQANVDPSLLKGEGDGRVNILLLGIGGNGHDGPDLTDTMMIASVDPVNKKATLLSIPRDLWVNIPNHGDMKINAAYETGKYQYLGYESASSSNHQAVAAGLSMADQTVEKVVGIPIQYNMLVDFQAFRQAVNTVGGVTIDVPSELYDPTMAWENNWNPVLAKPGVQEFNGDKALLYVRSRETTSDFARAERQRAVIVALKNKIISAGTLSNPLKISQLVNAFGDNVYTDFSLSDSMRLYDITRGIPDNEVKSIGLTDASNSYMTDGFLDNQDVLWPKAGMFNYSAIQQYVRSQLPDGYIIKEHAKVAVLNGTDKPGIATNEAEVLKSYGYDVDKIANAPSPNYTKTVLIDLTHGRDKYTKHYLEERFDVTATQQLPPSIHPDGGADFIVILGSQ